MEPLENVKPVEGLENEINQSEITTAIKQMKNNMAPELSGNTSEML